MKVQCSCGAKFEFHITQAMENCPVGFICPVCGLNSSEFVDHLIRQELGQTETPKGLPIPIVLSTPQAATPNSPAEQPPEANPAIVEVQAPPRCLKHPGQAAQEKCIVCSKPICPKCMELFGYVCSPLCKAKAEARRITIPVYTGQKSIVEARVWRRAVWIGSIGGILAAVLLGVWFWYAWFGSIPKPIFSVRFDEPAYAGQTIACGKNNDQLVCLHGDTLARYDLKTKKRYWSLHLLDANKLADQANAQLAQMQQNNARLRDNGDEDLPRLPSPDKLMQQMEQAAEEQMTLFVRGQNIWVASPEKVVRYDWETGKPLKELEVQAGRGGLISRGDELLVLNDGFGKPRVTHINLVSCDSKTEDLDAPQAGSLAEGDAVGAVEAGGSPTAGLPAGVPGSDLNRPMDPAKVAEQAQHLSLPARIALPATLANTMNQERTLAAMQDDQKRPQPAAQTSPQSTFSIIPTPVGFLEFSTKLLESHIVQESAMKPAPAKSVLSGNLTTGNTADAANEILNDMQRSRGGDVAQEDSSRYEVTLRNPGSDLAWTGEVIGPPKLFPLKTVNVLASDKKIMVFDKSNKKLWESSLAFSINGGLSSLEEGSSPLGQGPCVERQGSLYVFDEGVLTAFDLATGNVRWRLPSVGIAGLFFNDNGQMYVNTTTASPESLKYKRQIDISEKVGAVIIKIDCKTGKLLWTAQPGGLINYVSGKFVFAVQSYRPSEEEQNGPQTGFETPPYLRIRRINPKNGSEMWEYFQQRAPLDVAFDRNTFRLVFKNEVQVLKFLSF